MADMMAIVSKAIFEKDAPKAKLGDVLPMKFYRSASKHLERLEEGGRLFLVTVRPPSEALWLVAVLDAPQFDGTKWKADANRYPVLDISALISQLKFESGKGLVAKKGALGMSLQTPRALSGSDVALLLQTAGPAPDKPAPRPKQARPVNINKHEASAPLPCLCVSCLPTAPELLDVGGATFFRAQTELFERVLWFWVPAELKADLSSVAQSVKSRLRHRIKPYKADDDDKTKKSLDDDDDADGDED